mmetsp:Transcript_13767/g.39166  ORF Transcript_13767/g.39166 Transcript_13767/m.39166 type:complete len:338 (+) Transcript_13767:232-1245(+)
MESRAVGQRTFDLCTEQRRPARPIDGRLLARCAAGTRGARQDHVQLLIAVLVYLLDVGSELVRLHQDPDVVAVVPAPARAVPLAARHERAGALGEDHLRAREHDPLARGVLQLVDRQVPEDVAEVQRPQFVVSLPVLLRANHRLVQMRGQAAAFGGLELHRLQDNLGGLLAHDHLRLEAPQQFLVGGRNCRVVDLVSLLERRHDVGVVVKSVVAVLDAHHLNAVLCLDSEASHGKLGRLAPKPVRHVFSAADVCPCELPPQRRLADRDRDVPPEDPVLRGLRGQQAPGLLERSSVLLVGLAHSALGVELSQPFCDQAHSGLVIPVPLSLVPVVGAWR